VIIHPFKVPTGIFYLKIQHLGVDDSAQRSMKGAVKCDIRADPQVLEAWVPESKLASFLGV